MLFAGLSSSSGRGEVGGYMSDSDLVRTRLAGQGSGGHHGYTSDTSHPLNNGYTSDTTYADSAAHYSDRWSLKRTFAKFYVTQSQRRLLLRLSHG